jgi:hypothetical protein
VPTAGDRLLRGLADGRSPEGMPKGSELMRSQL